MKVRELIEKLREQDPEAEVLVQAEKDWDHASAMPATDCKKRLWHTELEVAFEPGVTLLDEVISAVEVFHDFDRERPSLAVRTPG